MKIEVTVEPPMFGANSNLTHRWRVSVKDDGVLVDSDLPRVTTTRSAEGTEETWEDAWTEASKIASTIARASADVAANTP